MTAQLFNLFLVIHRWLFAHSNLKKVHLHCFKLSLRSLGVLNSDTADATGEPKWLARLAKTDQIKTIIDVGANDSAYGANEFPDSVIYAFEPHPLSFKRLKKNAQPHVVPIHAAVGNQNGMTTLWDFAADAPLKSTQPTSQLASLYQNVITKLHGQPATAHQVPIISLDSFAEKHSLSHIDLLKIDAEGHELVVLKGAKRLLAKQRIGIIQFEFNEMMAYSRTHFIDFVTLLPDFTFYRLLPNDILPLGPYRPLTHEIYGFQNVVAIHKRLLASIV